MKLMILDGNSIINRTFYGIRMLTAPDGTPVNAVYGFLTVLHKLLEDERPDALCVAFDLKGPTFRHEAFEEYKATRRATPETLIPQIPYVKEIIRGFSIPVIEQQGLEADDIIGTIARRQAEAGMAVVKPLARLEKTMEAEWVPRGRSAAEAETRAAVTEAASPGERTPEEGERESQSTEGAAVQAAAVRPLFVTVKVRNSGMKGPPGAPEACQPLVGQTIRESTVT